MRIVYIRSNPMCPRMEKEMSAATAHGHSPVALVWDRDAEIFGIKKDDISLAGGSAPIYRIGIKAVFGGGFRKNFRPLLRWTREILKWLKAHRGEYDLICAFDFDTVLPALYMRLFNNKKYVYDICDFYIDAFSVPKFLKPLIKKADFYAIKKAEAVILTTESRKEQINGSKPKKLYFIHNSPLPGQLEKSTSEAPACSIFYGGILSHGRMILETARIVQRHPEWTYIIAGYGELEDDCRKLDMESGNVTYIGKQPYPSILSHTMQADLVFACYDPQVPNHRYSSPNKLYEAQMCSKPIVVCEGTGIDTVVSKENIGIVCRYSEESLEHAFKTLLDDKTLRDEMGRRSRALYDTRYSFDIMTQRLGAMYEEIEEKMIIPNA